MTPAMPDSTHDVDRSRSTPDALTEPPAAPHREAEASGAREEDPAMKQALAILADTPDEWARRVEQLLRLIAAAPTPPEADRALREAAVTMDEVNVYAAAYFKYVHNGVERDIHAACAIREEYWAAYRLLEDRLAALAPRPTPEDGTCQCAAPMTFAGKCVHCRRPTPEDRTDG